MKRFFLLGLAGVLPFVVAHAQLTPVPLSDPGATVEKMLSTLVGVGVTVTNVHYTGAAVASGTFCGGTGVVGFDSGILLTSGRAVDVVGPNNSPTTSTSNGTPGDPDLYPLGTVQTFDAAVLEFDFIPEGDTVTFRYVFGSEEYNEFVDTAFNDIFAFFVNGLNYATLPNSTTPVSINNVNNGFSSGTSTGPCNNCEFYIDNTGANQLDTQLDGLTKVLTFTAPVTAGQLNHLKLAIADGTDRIYDSAVFIESGSLRSTVVATTNNVTRDAAFWFRNPFPNAGTACVNLRDAIKSSFEFKCNAQILNLGFITLPQGYRNDDNVRDADDATYEALGFYWRKSTLTGELDGTQQLKYRGSRLCRERKQLAVELIAAQANRNYFSTLPNAMSYNNGHGLVPFPATLIKDAQAVAAGENVESIVVMTALLRKFNKSGLTNDFPDGLALCTEPPNKTLRSISRDPTTRLNCPGNNESCLTAQAIFFPSSQSGIFGKALYKTTVNLSHLTDDVISPSCGVGGADAVWKVTPEVGKTGRRFTVDTLGSNLDTLLSVYRGPCDVFTEIACNDGVDASTLQSKLSFSTDGTNTYYIVVEGKNSTVGKAKLKVTSP